MTASSVFEGWKSYSSVGSSQVYPPFTTILRQGSSAQDVFFVDRGVVKLTRLEEQGKELILAIRFPGWVLGTASAVLQKPNPISAITLTPCSLSRVTAQSFIKITKENPSLSWQLHVLHSREVFDQAVHLGELVCLSARHRLEYMLWDLMCEIEVVSQDNKKPFRIPLRQLEIAQLIAVTPQYLCEILKDMEDLNLIQRKKGWIMIPDPEKLRHRIDL
jgi:CRP-like cAMP-binding protein